MEDDQETPKVGSLAIECQKKINSLLAATKIEDCCAREFLHVRDVQRMQDRYNQWAGNLGALQHFKSPLSLDHRLQDAPLIINSIFNTLTDLDASIQAATDIATGRLQNRFTGTSIIELDTDLSEYNISSSESETSSILSSEYGKTALAPTSEIQELISAINTGIDALFKTSIFIRNFAPKDKRTRAAKTKPFDNHADVLYVKDRYPSVMRKNVALAARLGEANARRRQYFKYRRDHSERLSTVTTKGSPTSILKQHPGGNLSKAEPANSMLTADTSPSLFTETKATMFMADAAMQARTLDLYETPPAVSMVSFATSLAEISDEELPFPPVPVEVQTGSPFLCPYCLRVLHLKREGSEHQWSENVSDQQLSKLIDQSKRPIDFVQPNECPFCDDLWAKGDPSLKIDEESLVVDLDQFRRHVGHHLQQVALFALPRLIQDNELSRRSHDVGGLPDQDTISNGCRWIRDDCGCGWSIISRKRIIFFAFSFFLTLYRAHSTSSKLKNEISVAYNIEEPPKELRDLSQEDKYGQTPLSRAAAYGREAEVRSLLQRDVKVNCKDKRGQTPLSRAAENGHEMVVRLLLQQNDIESDSKDKYDQTPLSRASAYGREAVVRLLLERDDVEADSRDKNNQTPLSRAAAYGHEKVVQLLLQRHDVEADSKDDEYDQTPLSRAAENGHEAVVRLLVERDDVEVDFKDEYGRTPLTRAAAMGTKRWSDYFWSEMTSK